MFMPDISIFQAKLAPAKEYLQTIERTADLENHIDLDIIAQIFQDTYGRKDIKNISESHRITDIEYFYDILGNLHGILNDRSIKGRITKLRKKMFSAPSDAILNEDEYPTDFLYRNITNHQQKSDTKMPRTKRPTKKKESVIYKKSETDISHFKEFDDTYEQLKTKILTLKKWKIAEFKLAMKEEMLSIPVSIKNKKIKDLRQENASIWQNISDYSTTINSMLIPRNNTLVSRNHSNDEGYLTSESTTGNSGGTRRLRSSSASRIKQTESVKKPTRRSRSIAKVSTGHSNRISRAESRKSGARQSSRDKFRTPLNTKTMDSFAMVTPKVKPNTPQIVLRRAQIGEMAISLQGSPILTTPALETNANVNIPLPDGRMINIQPIHGLRRSQIPTLDPEVQRQLRTLKENLDLISGL
ncbi:hypothetical protein HHI36_003350 [Cryptolaemus montrouzieri]|uniref:Borealin C-terminal domain-containing protein n=1 Tax=Cryptolaemus montrouzieri TaxID=559131 RepID=A0ABD2PEM0_9CUCU